MKSTDPLFSYQNLFITARPGMGATTLAVNIINKYLDEGKKCLVFSGTHDCSPKYIERVKIIRENGDMNDLLRPRIQKYGNLSVVGNQNIYTELVLRTVEEMNPDLIVLEDPHTIKMIDRELIDLAHYFKEAGKAFVFVTHIKRKINQFTHIEKSTPSASYHRKAIRYFDTVVIVYRQEYYNDGVIDKENQEIRIYERVSKKYKAMAVDFDFRKQRIVLK